MRPTFERRVEIKGYTVIKKIADFVLSFSLATRGQYTLLAPSILSQGWQNLGQFATEKEQKIKNILEKNLSF